MQTIALHEVDIQIKINEGEFVAIMGFSGCGKSTLLNVLGLLDQATSLIYVSQQRGSGKYGKIERNGVRKILDLFSKTST